MVKLALVPVLFGLAAAACGDPPSPPLPPVWSATYDVPFDAMVNCLAAKPDGAFAVSPPEYFQDGVMQVAFTPSKTPRAGSAYTIRRAGSRTQVNWRRPGNVGDLDWLDNEARSRADRCATA